MSPAPDSRPPERKEGVDVVGVSSSKNSAGSGGGGGTGDKGNMKILGASRSTNPSSERTLLERIGGQSNSNRRPYSTPFLASRLSGGSTVVPSSSSSTSTTPSTSANTIPTGSMVVGPRTSANSSSSKSSSLKLASLNPSLPPKPQGLGSFRNFESTAVKGASRVVSPTKSGTIAQKSPLKSDAQSPTQRSLSQTSSQLPIQTRPSPSLSPIKLPSNQQLESPSQNTSTSLQVVPKHSAVPPPTLPTIPLPSSTKSSNSNGFPSASKNGPSSSSAIESHGGRSPNTEWDYPRPEAQRRDHNNDFDYDHHSTKRPQRQSPRRGGDGGELKYRLGSPSRYGLSRRDDRDWERERDRYGDRRGTVGGGGYKYYDNYDDRSYDHWDRSRDRVGSSGGVRYDDRDWDRERGREREWGRGRGREYDRSRERDYPRGGGGGGGRGDRWDERYRGEGDWGKEFSRQKDNARNKEMVMEKSGEKSTEGRIGQDGDQARDRERERDRDRERERERGKDHNYDHYRERDREYDRQRGEGLEKKDRTNNDVRLSSAIRPPSSPVEDGEIDELAEPGEIDQSMNIPSSAPSALPPPPPPVEDLPPPPTSEPPPPSAEDLPPPPTSEPPPPPAEDLPPLPTSKLPRSPPVKDIPLPPTSEPPRPPSSSPPPPPSSIPPAKPNTTSSSSKGLHRAVVEGLLPQTQLSRTSSLGDGSGEVCEDYDSRLPSAPNSTHGPGSVPHAPNRNLLNPSTRTSTPAGEEGGANRQPEWAKRSGSRSGESNIKPAMIPKPFRRPTWEEELKRFEKTFVGTTTLAAYDVGAKLGEGTFGVVTKGVELATKRQVALKKLITHNPRDGVSVTTVREIKILKALDHINIVPIIDMVVERKRLNDRSERSEIFMVFPFMDHDLCGLLLNRKFHLTHSITKLLLKQILEGLAYLHINNIVHRDIKTANILVDKQGQVKIADFGLARSWEIEKMPPHMPHEYTNMVVTRWYRAPELLLGDTHYGSAIDLWSVGCILGEMYHREPILAGDSDRDQLYKIFSRVGPPNNDSFPGWDQLPGFPDAKGHPWDKTKVDVPILTLAKDWNMDRTGADLLIKLLCLDPKRRFTAEQALNHPWFWIAPAPAALGSIPVVESSHEMTSRKHKEQPPQRNPYLAPQPATQAPPLRQQQLQRQPAPSWSNSGGGGGGGGSGASGGGMGHFHSGGLTKARPPPFGNQTYHAGPPNFGSGAPQMSQNFGGPGGSGHNQYPPSQSFRPHAQHPSSFNSLMGQPQPFVVGGGGANLPRPPPQAQIAPNVPAPPFNLAGSGVHSMPRPPFPLGGGGVPQPSFQLSAGPGRGGYGMGGTGRGGGGFHHVNRGGAAGGPGGPSGGGGSQGLRIPPNTYDGGGGMKRRAGPFEGDYGDEKRRRDDTYLPYQ